MIILFLCVVEFWYNQSLYIGWNLIRPTNTPHHDMRSLIKKDPVSMLIWGNKTEIKRYKQFTLNGYAKNILQGNPLRQENLKGTAWFCSVFRHYGYMDCWIPLLFKSRRNNSIQLQSDHVTVPNSIYSGLFLGISNLSKTI